MSQPVLAYEPAPKVLRITATEEEPLALESLSAFLYDLVLLHDRLVLVFSEEYEHRYLLTRYFYQRRGRGIRKQDRLGVRLVAKESPLTIELVLAAAVAIPAITFTLLQILEWLADRKVNRRLKQLDELLKEMQVLDALENLRPILSRKYGDEAARVERFLLRDVVRLGSNEQVSIDRVEDVSSDSS